MEGVFSSNVAVVLWDEGCTDYISVILGPGTL
jgi:hypothetical protein